MSNPPDGYWQARAEMAEARCDNAKERIAELEAKVSRLTSRGIEDMQFRIAELEALLRGGADLLPQG